MDITERTLRSATEHFRQADLHLRDTEAQLRKLLLRLQMTSNPAASVMEETYSVPLPLEEPVPAGS